jgi:hypothetical protein
MHIPSAGLPKAIEQRHLRVDYGTSPPEPIRRSKLFKQPGASSRIISYI